jgi:hypothetical protein
VLLAAKHTLDPEYVSSWLHFPSIKFKTYCIMAAFSYYKVQNLELGASHDVLLSSSSELYKVHHEKIRT